MPNAPDPLQDLRDVHMPDPISWWPPAFGWWMIMGCAGHWRQPDYLGLGLSPTDTTSTARVGSTQRCEAAVCGTFR